MAVNFQPNVIPANNNCNNIAIPKYFTVSKRVFDITVCLLLLPFAAAGILLAVLLTCLSSRGPVFFIQERVGIGGKVFKMYKIRTMLYKPGGYHQHTVPGDKRITPAGRLLRKVKMDELPQLLNVLRGDMSLIGPRPERVEIANYFSAIDKNYAGRHVVKPGITGLAQVCCPMATPSENLIKLKFDLYYITHFSMRLELKIIFKTIGVICRMKSL